MKSLYKVIVLPILRNILARFINTKAVEQACKNFIGGNLADYGAKHEAKTVVKPTDIAKSLPNSVTNALL